MALVINDRVKETSTTTGTGAFTLDGAQTGFDTFALGIGGSNTTYYAI
jgi:glycerate kinase